MLLSLLVGSKLNFHIAHGCGGGRNVDCDILSNIATLSRTEKSMLGLFFQILRLLGHCCIPANQDE
jgi:hypothetical protein